MYLTNTLAAFEDIFEENRSIRQNSLIMLERGVC